MTRAEGTVKARPQILGPIGPERAGLATSPRLGTLDLLDQFDDRPLDFEEFLGDVVSNRRGRRWTNQFPNLGDAGESRSGR
jgi:hypothetical protein